MLKPLYYWIAMELFLVVPVTSGLTEGRSEPKRFIAFVNRSIVLQCRRKNLTKGQQLLLTFPKHGPDRFPTNFTWIKGEHQILADSHCNDVNAFDQYHVIHTKNAACHLKISFARPDVIGIYRSELCGIFHVSVIDRWATCKVEKLNNDTKYDFIGKAGAYLRSKIEIKNRCQTPKKGINESSKEIKTNVKDESKEVLTDERLLKYIEKAEGSVDVFLEVHRISCSIKYYSNFTNNTFGVLAQPVLYWSPSLHLYSDARKDPKWNIFSIIGHVLLTGVGSSHSSYTCLIAAPTNDNHLKMENSYCHVDLRIGEGLPTALQPEDERCYIWQHTYLGFVLSSIVISTLITIMAKLGLTRFTREELTINYPVKEPEISNIVSTKKTKSTAHLESSRSFINFEQINSSHLAAIMHMPPMGDGMLGQAVSLNRNKLSWYFADEDTHF